METRRIGSLEVSVVGLGCNNFGRRLDAERSAVVVNAALDNGINFFDTADVYGAGLSEEYIARALGSRRSEVIIASKFANQMEGQGRGAHPDYIRIAVEASLRRLNTDVIDLYQQHVPDPDVPIADTLGALDDLVKAGKIREIGSSNFTAEQIREADAASLQKGFARFMSIQNRYSMLHREPEENGVLAECERTGQGFLPYFPLESGLLTGKIQAGHAPEGSRLSDPNSASRFLTERNLALTERLTEFAVSRGHTILELAFAWLLKRPVVASVIAGATKPEQVKANIAAAGWSLTDADMNAIAAILSQPAQSGG
jgi:aryl-alcohol dehydrogenase-like predicted oxidoreductase